MLNFRRQTDRSDEWRRKVLHSPLYWIGLSMVVLTGLIVIGCLIGGAMLPRPGGKAVFVIGMLGYEFMLASLLSATDNRWQRILIVVTIVTAAVGIALFAAMPVTPYSDESTIGGCFSASRCDPAIDESRWRIRSKSSECAIRNRQIGVCCH